MNRCEFCPQLLSPNENVEGKYIYIKNNTSIANAAITHMQIRHNSSHNTRLHGFVYLFFLFFRFFLFFFLFVFHFTDYYSTASSQIEIALEHPSK